MAISTIVVEIQRFLLLLEFASYCDQSVHDFLARLFKVSRHSIKFGGDRHGGRGYIMILVFRVISRNHVMKESRDFTGGNPSW